MNARLCSLLGITAGLAIATIGNMTGAANAETTLITLGTAGGPVPRPDRAQSSNLLIVNGTLYLIDAGGGVTARLVQSGNNFRKVGKIFITHAHSDHTAGLATLLVSSWEQQGDPTDVYGGGVEALVKGAIEYLTPNAEIRWAEGKKRPMTDTFHGHDVAPGVVYQDANVKVTAVENTHFHFQLGTPPYGKYKSYSYRFETPDRVVFFSGDTGPSDAVVELAKGADLYVTETTLPEDEKWHLAVQDAGRAAGLLAPHARGARDADGHRPNGGQGQRQGRGDDPSRPVARSQGRLSPLRR